MAREGLLIGSPKSGEEVGNVSHPQEKEKEKKNTVLIITITFPATLKCFYFYFYRVLIYHQTKI